MAVLNQLRNLSVRWAGTDQALAQSTAFVVQPALFSPIDAGLLLFIALPQQLATGLCTTEHCPAAMELQQCHGLHGFSERETRQAKQGVAKRQNIRRQALAARVRAQSACSTSTLLRLVHSSWIALRIALGIRLMQ